MAWQLEVGGQLGSWTGFLPGIYVLQDDDPRVFQGFIDAANTTPGVSIFYREDPGPLFVAPEFFPTEPDPSGLLTLSMLKGEAAPREDDLRCKVPGCPQTEPYRTDHARKIHHSRMHKDVSYDELYAPPETSTAPEETVEIEGREVSFEGQESIPVEALEDEPATQPIPEKPPSPTPLAEAATQIGEVASNLEEAASQLGEVVTNLGEATQPESTSEEQAKQ